MNAKVGNNTTVELNSPTKQPLNSKYAGMRILAKPEGQLPSISIQTQQNEEQQQPPQAQQAPARPQKPFKPGLLDKVIGSYMDGLNQQRNEVNKIFSEMGDMAREQDKTMMQSMYGSINNPLMAGVAASYKSPTTYNPDSAPKSMFEKVTTGILEERAADQRYKYDLEQYGNSLTGTQRDSFYRQKAMEDLGINPESEAHKVELSKKYNEMRQANNQEPNAEWQIPAMRPQNMQTRKEWLQEKINSVNPRNIFRPKISQPQNAEPTSRPDVSPPASSASTTDEAASRPDQPTGVY